VQKRRFGFAEVLYHCGQVGRRRPWPLEPAPERLDGHLVALLFNVQLKCANCKGKLRLIALIKTQATIKKILALMALPPLCRRKMQMSYLCTIEMS
jgi:hypothetical protein